MATALTTLETLLRAKKLDVTLTSARPWSSDDREARLAPTGWPSVDAALGGGFPRGECSEIVGPPSSGRTAVTCALLAAAAARGDVMALIDTFDSFDPVSAAAMDLDLSCLLWVRGTLIRPGQGRPGQGRLGQERPEQDWPEQDWLWPGRPGPGDKNNRSTPSPRSCDAPGDLLARVVDRAIKSFGLVLQAGGFGVVVLDLADVPMTAVRRLPFTTWLRVQRLIEGRDTIGLVLAQEPVARSARGVTMRLGRWGAGSEAGPGPGAGERASGTRASETIWSGASDRARRCVGFALQPRVGSAHRIDRDRASQQSRSSG